VYGSENSELAIRWLVNVDFKNIASRKILFRKKLKAD
jgi:hypothetical protein